MLKRPWILPVVQMGLAVALIRWSQTLERLPNRYCDMPGNDPPFLVMSAMNAPIRLAGMLFDDHLPYPENLGAWITVVGLFWYWVSCGLKTWQKRREALIPRWRFGRLLIDALLIIMGALFGLMGATEAKDAAWKAQWLKPMVGCFGFSGWSESLNFLVVACLHLGWCAVLVPIFGRDFARCLRRVPGVVEPRSC